MNDDELHQLISRAFPERVDEFPEEEIWLLIDPGAPSGAQIARLFRPVWWAATAAVVVVASLALFLGRPQTYIERDPASLARTLSEFERADDRTRAWVIEHHPHQWKLNEPAALALDRAIAETRALLEENPGDPELQSRIVMYANWRADLLGGLAYESG